MAIFLNVYGIRDDEPWGRNDFAPTWLDVVTAVRKCDGGRYLGASLTFCADNEPDRSVNIEGGPNLFRVLYGVEDQPHTIIGGSTHRVPIETALETMQYFFNHAKPPPDANWQPAIQ